MLLARLNHRLYGVAVAEMVFNLSAAARENTRDIPDHLGKRFFFVKAGNLHYEFHVPRLSVGVTEFIRASVE